MADFLPPDPLEPKPKQKAKKRGRFRAGPITTAKEVLAENSRVYEAKASGSLDRLEAASQQLYLKNTLEMFKLAGGSRGGSIEEGADLDGLVSSDAKLRAFEAQEDERISGEVERRLAARLNDKSESQEDVDPLDGVRGISQNEEELSR